MIQFNSNNIIVNYIKQLLHSFNLPQAHISKDKKYLKNQYYIVNNNICVYNEEEGLKVLRDYRFNDFIPNLTRNLKITNNIYDSYTHKYLGDYLRFIRDYKGVNLMQLYNCFSNEYPEYCEISEFNFNTSDKSYTITAIPVKNNQTYTIALNSDVGYEILCAYRDPYNKIVNYGQNLSGLYRNSYRKIAYSNFSQPYIYTLPTIDNIYVDGKEKELVLLLKLPANYNTSIVVLEGDYRNNFNYYFTEKGLGTSEIPLKIFNYKLPVDFKIENVPENIPTKNQLLKMSDGISYPFADRLIEYLSFFAITPLDRIDDNIYAVQNSLYKKYNNYDLIKVKGEWSPLMKRYINYLMTQGDISLLSQKEDLLGYVDKDVESKLEI